MKTKTASLFATMALTCALAGAREASEENADHNTRTNASHWKVQVGWVHQWGRSMSVHGPSPTPYTGGRSLLSSAPGLTYPDNTLFIPRQFDNGYVNPDLWTGDSSVSGGRENMTWFWGADSAGQYNYDGGIRPTLTFSRDQGEYVGSAYTTQQSGDSEEDMPTDGIEIMVKRSLYAWTREGGTSNKPNEEVWLDLSLIIGMAWFPSARQRHVRAMGQDVYGLSESYTYLDYYGTPAGGSNPALGLPYSGTYGAIGSPDAGALIPALPDSALQTATYLGSLDHRIGIESKLWRLRGAMGLEFSFLPIEQVSIFVAPQLVCEFVDMSVNRTESSSYSGVGGGSTSQYASKHKMGVYPGALLTLGANYLITQYLYLGASVGYEWLCIDPSVKVGPDKIEYDLNGGEFSLYVGFRF